MAIAAPVPISKPVAKPASSKVTVRSGTVHHTEGALCWVRLEPGGCDGCQCGFASDTGLHAVAVPAGLVVPGPGARVVIELAQARLRQVVWTVFGTPLVGLLSGSIIAELWRTGLGLAGAAAGLSAGVGVTWLLARRLARTEACKPTLVVDRPDAGSSVVSC